ncbi:hypothetical protein QOZ80_9AG0690960 [Eleusine coracana subsp. coracana]|nr:hypothetical protein QOZ80_9AG0690960 [Eleusine coracana subsp. coracana]
MAAADRLSDLPDDLLRRVLYFVPAKEGASTAVLSRRWRSLWRSCGAVNLDSRSYKPLVDDLEGEDFLQDAMAALAVSAAQGPVRRLSFHMEGSHKFHIHRFLSYGQDESERNLIGEVMASPAARNAEELRIAGLVPNMSSYPCLRGGYYKLSVDDLPHEALGVLHIVNAELEVGWSGALFPRLNSLLLRGCHVSFQNLQAMIHPAPQLTTVRLESIFLLRGRHGEDDSSSTSSNHGCQIRGLEVTTLVLTDWSSYNGSMTMENIEFDMPKLQYFRYEWFSRFQVSLKSWANNLTQVDFHFNKDSIYDQDEAVVSFWHFLRNFSNAKVFNLKLDCPINEIAVTDMKSLDELLDDKLLFNLERLESIRTEF